MNKRFLFVIFLIVLVASSFFLGYSKGRRDALKQTHVSDTVTVTRTRYIDSPIPKSTFDYGKIAVPSYEFIAETVHDTTTVLEYIHTHDTLYLPMQQKYYEEAEGRLRIWVSGYEPNLDRYELDEVIKTVAPREKQWNVSLVAGGGVCRDGLSPFVGIAVGRTIFRF